MTSADYDTSSLAESLASSTFKRSDPLYRKNLLMRMSVPIYFCALVGFAYWPAFTHIYGYNDDYPYLVKIRDGSFSLVHNVMVTQGRPLQDLFFWIAYGLPQTIADLRWVRLATALGICLFCWIVYRFQVRAGSSRFTALVIASLIGLVPGVAVYVAGWAIFVFSGPCSAVALWGGELIWGGTTEKVTGWGNKQTILGVLLVLVALCTFQPLAMFCVYSFLVLFAENQSEDAKTFRHFLKALVLFLLSICIYFVLYKITVLLLYNGHGQAYRGQLEINPFSKLKYFGHLLAAGAGLWAQFYGNVLWLVVCAGSLALIAGWIFFTAKARHVPRGAVLLCTALCLPLSVLPMLAVKENEFAFRTQAVMEAIFVYLVISGLSCFSKSLYTRLKQSWVWFATVTLFLGLVALFALAARHNVYTGIVKPNAHEVAALRMGIRKIDGFPKKLTYIVPPQATEPGDNIGEFGQISSPLPWVTRAMLELLFIKEHEGGIALRTAVRRHEGFSVQYGGGRGTVPVLNGFRLLDGHLTHVHDHYWGNVQENSHGWCVSDWFGVFDNRFFPHIFSSELGWLYCSGKGIDDYWFWNRQLGWFWTSPGVFPKLYIKKSQSWVYLSQTIGPHAIYDCKKKKWESFQGS